LKFFVQLRNKRYVSVVSTIHSDCYVARDANWSARRD